MRFYAAFLFILMLLTACTPADEKKSDSELNEPDPLNFTSPDWIIRRPVSFSNWRIEETRKYAVKHYSSDNLRIKPKMIVIHWTVTPDLELAYKIFNREHASGKRHLLKENGLNNVAVPYLVDRDGTVVQLMHELFMGRHVIGMNHYAIGIENIGGMKDTRFLTEAQIKANIKLIRYLKKKYHQIDYVIGHREYLRFKETGHKLWKENIKNYIAHKVDPDVKSLNAIKAGLKDLNLKSVP